VAEYRPGGRPNAAPWEYQSALLDLRQPEKSLLA
jgi:hypothetical protein